MLHVVLPPATGGAVVFFFFNLKLKMYDVVIYFITCVALISSVTISFIAPCVTFCRFIFWGGAVMNRYKSRRVEYEKRQEAKKLAEKDPYRNVFSYEGEYDEDKEKIDMRQVVSRKSRSISSLARTKTKLSLAMTVLKKESAMVKCENFQHLHSFQILTMEFRADQFSQALYTIMLPVPSL